MFCTPGHKLNVVLRLKLFSRAPHGEKGQTRDCNGKNAQHLIIKVPLGTIIKDDNSKVLFIFIVNIPLRVSGRK